MILISGQIESIKSRKDKTTAIVLGSQEMSPKIAGELFSLQNSFVYVAIKEEEFKTNELEVLKRVSLPLQSTMIIRWKD